MEPAPEHVPHPDDEGQSTPPVDPYFHQMPGVEANYGRTILDYLNEDCWSAVLNYVPIVDIIKSECVSRQWQRVVLTYLSHARIGVMRDWYIHGHEHRNVLMFQVSACPSFESWTKKLGPSLVAYHCDRDTENGLDIISENCPNLEELMLFWVDEPLNKNEYFHNLQKLCFYECSVTDACVSQFLTSNDLEELKILDNEFVTGECLTNLKSTKLKVLVLQKCSSLQLPLLLSVATRLGGLTKLVLKRVPEETGWNAHLLLDKLPRLEYLLITFNGHFRPDNTKSNMFYELVSRLSNLEYLLASHDASDHHIEAMMKGCKKLRCLHVPGKWSTKRGMAAICGAGARLASLFLPGESHDNVEACVRACPNLTLLVVGVFLTQELARRVVDVRRALAPLPPRLTLDTGGGGGCERRLLHGQLEGNESIIYVKHTRQQMKPPK